MKIIIKLFLFLSLFACKNEKDSSYLMRATDFKYELMLGPSFHIKGDVTIVKNKELCYMKLIAWDYPFSEDYYNPIPGEPIDTILVNTKVFDSTGDTSIMPIPRVIFINDSCLLTQFEMNQYLSNIDTFKIMKPLKPNSYAVHIDGIGFKNTLKIDTFQTSFYIHSPKFPTREYFLIHTTLELLKTKFKDLKTQKYLLTIDDYL